MMSLYKTKTEASKSPAEQVADLFIAYGLKGHDPFFCTYSIRDISLYELKLQITVAPKCENLPEIVEKPVLEEVMEIGMKGFFTFWTRSHLHDWAKTRFLYKHKSCEFSYGDSIVMDVSFEETRRGSTRMKCQLASVSTSLNSTTTRVLAMGEGCFFCSDDDEETSSNQTPLELVPEMIRNASKNNNNMASERLLAPATLQIDVLSDFSVSSSAGSGSTGGFDFFATDSTETAEEPGAATTSDNQSSNECLDSSSYLASSRNTLPDSRLTRNSEDVDCSNEPSIKKRRECSMFEMNEAIEQASSSPPLSTTPGTSDRAGTPIESSPNPELNRLAEMLPHRKPKIQQRVWVDKIMDKSIGLVFDKEMRVTLVQSGSIFQGILFAGDTVEKVDDTKCYDSDEFYDLFIAESEACVHVLREDRNYEDMQDAYKMQEKLQEESCKTKEGFGYIQAVFESRIEDDVLGCRIRSYEGKVYVTHVDVGSAAEKFLKRGDRVLEVNGNIVSNDQEACQLIHYYFVTNGKVQLNIERPIVPRTSKLIADIFNNVRSWIAQNDGDKITKRPARRPLIVKMPSKLTTTPQSQSNENEISILDDGTEELHTVESSVSILSIFAISPTRTINDEEENVSEHSSSRKWSTKDESKWSPTQDVLQAPEANESDYLHEEMNQDSTFTLINVKSRLISKAPEVVLSKLLRKIGIKDGYKFVSNVRLPVKGSRYVMKFYIWDLTKKKMLHKMIGSEKSWMNRFNVDVLKQEHVFVWKDITIECVQLAVLSSTLKRFDSTYILPQYMHMLEKDSIINLITSSSQSQKIKNHIKKVLWDSSIRELNI